MNWDKVAKELFEAGDEASAKARIARGQEAIAVQTAAVFFNRLAHAIKAGTEE